MKNEVELLLLLLTPVVELLMLDALELTELLEDEELLRELWLLLRELWLLLWLEDELLWLLLELLMLDEELLLLTDEDELLELL